MIYVDALRFHERGCRSGSWCHLATDGELDELHDFVRQIGLPRRAFHAHPRHPHYDLNGDARELAIAAGAIVVTSKELVRRCFRQGGGKSA